MLRISTPDVMHQAAAPSLHSTLAPITSSAAFRERHWKFQNRAKGMMWLGSVVQKI